MSYLHRKPQQPDALGRIHQITPENAHWHYVGFEVVLLRAGQSQQYATGNGVELCAVLLSGQAKVHSATLQADRIGQRMSVAEVMAEILRDRIFYEESGGGATNPG